LKRPVTTIELPGKKEDAGRSEAFTQSPRLLREVSGDFEAEVRLGGSFRAIGQIPSPHVEAGLILMGEERVVATLSRENVCSDAPGHENYLRVDVSSEDTEKLSGRRLRIANWTADQDFYFCLGRNGKKLFAYWSMDGKGWKRVPLKNESLPAKLSIGVFAASTSKEPFKPRFDKFKLTLTGKKGRAAAKEKR
jgi:regulation of enolase protein 1 (concanavalin A-like superfamily)